MGRIRTVKPGFWKDEDMSRLAEPTRLLALALLNYADDEGYFNANELLIKAECFPLNEPSLNIHGMFTELSNMGYLKLGKSDDGKSYGHIVNFLEHQRVSHSYPSNIKGLDIQWEDSMNVHGVFMERSSLNRNRNRNRKRNSNKETTLVENKKIIFDTQVGRFKNISPTLKEKWEEAYPATNVTLEIKKAETWLMANPKNRKSNYERFLNSWLTRTQDKAPKAELNDLSISSDLATMKRREAQRELEHGEETEYDEKITYEELTKALKTKGSPVII